MYGKKWHSKYFSRTIGKLYNEKLKEGIEPVVTANYEFDNRTRPVKKFLFGNLRMHGSKRLILMSFSFRSVQYFPTLLDGISPVVTEEHQLKNRDKSTIMSYCCYWELLTLSYKEQKNSQSKCLPRWKNFQLRPWMKNQTSFTQRLGFENWENIILSAGFWKDRIISLLMQKLK